MKKSISYFFFFVFLLLFVGILVAVSQLSQSQTAQSRADLTAAAKNCNISRQEVNLDSEEKKFIGLLNKYRKQNKLKTVKQDDALTKAAAWMSSDMATNDYFDHIDSLRRTASERLSDCGHAQDAGAKENIANAYETADEVMKTWQKSKEHDRAMKNDAIKYIGVARHYEKNSQFGWYWTLDMGTKGKGNKKDSGNDNSDEVTPTPKNQGKDGDKKGGKGNKKDDTTKEPTATATVMPTPIPSGTRLKLTVKIPGVGSSGNRKPIDQERDIEVFVSDRKDTQVADAIGTLTFDGSTFYVGEIDSGVTLPDGAYILRVRMDNTLRKVVSGQFVQIKEAAVNALPQITLYQGDFDQNNRVDIRDYNIFTKCLEECDEEAIVDLNSDGKIDILDFNLLNEVFTTQQGD